MVEAGPTDAPPLLLLHGYPTSSLDYARVLPRLSRTHRVIVHDHPGFGLSGKPPGYSYSLFEQAEVALALWQTLGVQQGHVVAHDYGTSVATELVARRERVGLPLRIRSLVLSNGSVHLDLARPRAIQKLLKRPVLGPLISRLGTAGMFKRNMRAIQARTDALSEAELETMWALLTGDGGRRVLPVVTRYLDERVRFANRWIGALTRLEIPTLVLWGTADPVAVVAVAEALAGEIPGARMLQLDGVGHYPMLEAPGPWARAVSAFIDTVEVGDGGAHGDGIRA